MTNISEIESAIKKDWDDNNTFERSIKNRSNNPLYTFYDGPPFATGLPHYGHILVGTVKDVFGRFKTMNNYKVPRNAGWDCHGVPIEMIANKKLEIKTKQDVLNLGIDNYNRECRKDVMKCAKDWWRIIGKTGRWIDFQDDYKTMDQTYMESVWWAFKELYDKGLVYNGFKVSSYSVGCGTSLSNFESNLNYKDIEDPSILVKFKIKTDKTDKSYLVAWTTTPWTLPSNMALCSGKNIDMVEVLCEYDDVFDYEYLTMSKKKFDEILKNEETDKETNKETEYPKYTVLRHFNSSELEGISYEPLYNVSTSLFSLFRVLIDDYVRDDDGTGIVHLSPAHGEDDYRVCMKNGILDSGIISLIDDNGCFELEDNPTLNKIFYRDCNPLIIEDLETRGLLFENKTIVHSFPHCWRTETPLINRAMSSWFINIEKIKPQMVELSEQINWVPKTAGNRFKTWLENAHDWNVSRSRYWGTPIPIWRNDEGETICIGSIDELNELTGICIDDLHREFIDDIEIPSKTGGKPLKRIEDVFDCWFESGSMPFARCHYPFERKSVETFSSSFPADFISESSDQIRCWFYNLHVLSTALFDSIAFKNVIVTGLILAEDGQKMSKSKNNYPDPMDIIDKYGADALRLYLIGSQVVRAESLCFKEDMVCQIAKDIIIPLINTCAFYKEHLRIADEFHLAEIKQYTPEWNVMDNWIMQKTITMATNIKDKLNNYTLDNITLTIRDYVETLNNVYIKLNRGRFKGLDDVSTPISILRKILSMISKVFAPLMPFCSDYIHSILNTSAESVASSSVHLCSYPVVKICQREDGEKEDSIVKIILESITTIRRLKQKQNFKNTSQRFPIKSAVIFIKDDLVDGAKGAKEYFINECNILDVEFKPYSSANIIHEISPNDKNLGKKFRDKRKDVIKSIMKMSKDEILELLNGGFVITSEGFTVETEDVKFKIKLNDVRDGDVVDISKDLIIILDTGITKEMTDLFTVRLFRRQIQECRKNAGLHPWEPIKIFYKGNEEFVDIVESNRIELMKSIEYTIGIIRDDLIGEPIAEWKGDISEHSVEIVIYLC